MSEWGRLQDVIHEELDRQGVQGVDVNALIETIANVADYFPGLLGAREDSLEMRLDAAVAAMRDQTKPRWRYFHGGRLKLVGPWDIQNENWPAPTWQAIAEPYNATGHGLDREIEALGHTPAAALQTLAAKLRDQAATS